MTASLRVAVRDDYTGAAARSADWRQLDGIASVDFFRDHVADPAALVARLRDYDVIVAERERTPFPRALLEALPRLRLLATTGPVNWSIDLAAAAERGVVVTCTEALFDATPELTWALILALTRRVVWEDRAVRAGRWQDDVGVSLTGKRLGLIGLGNVGAKVAAVARLFGMTVIAWSRNLTQERAAAAGAEAVTLDALLSTADIVSIHVVLSERTRGLIGARELGLMKPDAYLVNTARGPIVDEAALIDALQQRRIAGAGIDVFEVEPLPQDHPLRRLDNVIATPHVGYITAEQYRLFYGQVVEAILGFARGAPVRVLRMP